MTNRADYLSANFGDAWLERVFGAATTLPPYFHPTRCCLIDDNQSFIESIQFELDSFWPHQAFTQGQRALDQLHAAARPTLAERCLATYRDAEGDPAVTLHLEVIEETIANPDRFGQTSVLLIDYAMPQLPGLEVCRRVRLPGVQRVMLTGVADDAAAVEAFNAGLIEHFVKKQQLSSARAIVDLVGGLERLYFDAQAIPLNTARTAPLLADGAVTRFVFEQLKHFNAVEFYLVTQPSGLLLLDAYGRRRRLLIVDTLELERQCAEAQQWRAPTEVQAALVERRALLFLWDHPEEYGPGDAFPWRDRLYTAQQLPGAENWYAAIVDDPPGDIDFDPEESCFFAYLRRFEAPSFST